MEIKMPKEVSYVEKRDLELEQPGHYSERRYY